ncbi:NUDIX domain-containing protein [Rhodobacter sp. NTK016B]|uniref:NUDIX domain-containing protein n=1 Tax=Rhodobacter sp. NTK016B TaxID=2759676 RepID=UPI001A8F8560|nr:NUDIX domain-containing protein [Rhodobacter sp. NTK016B]MBN8293774.1 NUDIX domain-containing protein [Rhodobacter sp. NTK016B]
MGFSESYLGQLRELVGDRVLIVVGVRVLIEDEAGRILILKRTDTGDWGLPAGALELDESLNNAIHREAWEEANARLGEVQVFGISSNPETERFTYPNGHRIQNVSVLARARFIDGALATNDGEASDFRWVHADEVVEEHFTRPEWPSLLAFGRWRDTGEFQFF